MALPETNLTVWTDLALDTWHHEEQTSAKLSMQNKTPSSSAETQTESSLVTPRTPPACDVPSSSSTLDASGSSSSTTTMPNLTPLESGAPPTEAGSNTAPQEWRRVPGYDEFEVTADGAIRENGGPARLRVAGSGHLYVLRTFSRPALLVHRGVLLAFEGPCPPGHVCRHLNDNPADNRWSADPTKNNLKWGTKKQNAEDRVRNASSKPGWTDERRHLERIKQLEEENAQLRAQSMRLKATIMNFIADRSFRITQSLLKELGLS